MSVKLRLQLPFLDWTLVNGTVGGFPVIGFGGGALSVELRHIALEAGGQLLFNGPSFSEEVYARTGWTHDLLHRREDGRGMRLQVAGLLGYRYLKRAGDPDGHFGTEQSHCLSIAAGLEPAYHFRRHFGINARLLVGLSLPLAQERTGAWADHHHFDEEDDMKLSLDLGLSLGFSF